MNSIERRTRRGERGSALISALIAVGIIGIVMVSAMELISFMNRSTKSIEIKGDRESMRRSLMERISCQATLGSNPQAICSQGLIDVKGRMPDRSEYVIISKSGTKHGSWTYQAKCNANGGIVVRAAMPIKGASLTSSNPSDFLPDPMTKKEITWASSSSLLLPDGQSFCGDGLRAVRAVSGTYDGTCGALTWMLCPRLQEIKLGGKPVQVQLYNVNSGMSVGITPFSVIKFDTMTGDQGWQSITSFAGITLPAGPIMNYFNATVKITDNGFVVRKAANIKFQGILGIISTKYHYVAFVEE